MTTLGVALRDRGGSIALLDSNGELLATQTIDPDTSLAISLPRAIAEISSSFSSFSLLCLTNGPGAYTSLRIGLSVLKGFSCALGVPLFGVSSLRVRAACVEKPPETETVAVVLDARNAEVYIGVYNPNGEKTTALLPDFVTEPENATTLLKRGFPELCIEGEGVTRYPELFKDFPQGKGNPAKEAEMTARIGRAEWNQTGKTKSHPALSYLRPSEPERKNNITVY